MIVSGVLPISKAERAQSMLRIEVKTLVLPCLQASSARTCTHTLHFKDFLPSAPLNRPESLKTSTLPRN